MLASPVSQSAAPGVVRRVDHHVGDAFADPLVAGVDRDDLRLASAEPDRCLLLPLVREAVDLGQVRRVRKPVNEERERSPGVYGLELMGVADEQCFRACSCGNGRDAVKRCRIGERGLVDDDQLATAQLSAAVVVFVEPLRCVFTTDAKVPGQCLCCRCGRRQADDAPPAMLGAPCGAKRIHRGRLARACWSDEYVDDSTRRTDRCHCTTLLGAQLDPATREVLLHDGLPNGGTCRPFRPGEQPCLGIEHRDRGVLLAVPRAEHARSVLALETPRRQGQLRRGQHHRLELCCLDDETDDMLHDHAVEAKRRSMVCFAASAIRFQWFQTACLTLTAATTSAAIASTARIGTSSTVSGSPVEPSSRRSPRGRIRAQPLQRRGPASRL